MGIMRRDETAVQVAMPLRVAPIKGFERFLELRAAERDIASKRNTTGEQEPLSNSMQSDTQ